MIVIGLTGGIGMGKSTVSRQFALLSAKICSADECVHKLMGAGGAAIPEIKKYFPEAVVDTPSPAGGGGLGRGCSGPGDINSAPLLTSTLRGEGFIDRKILGQIVFADKQKLKLLENILHPLVREMEDDFIFREKSLGAKLIVLDIPLLFETGAEKRVDTTVTVSAPAFIQKQRVMARPGMTAEKFGRIIASQMRDLEKRRRADFVIPTGLGKAYSFKIVKEIAEVLGSGLPKGNI